MRPLRILALLVFAAVSLGGAVAAGAVTTSLVVNSELFNALSKKTLPPGEVVPEVVVRVGHRELTASEFARQVALVE